MAERPNNPADKVRQLQRRLYVSAKRSRRRRFHALFVHRRLVRLMARRGGDRRKPFRVKEWPLPRFVKEHGLHRLVGTIRYPGEVHAT